eukprot:344884-Amphidinium_carterae.3
MACYKAFPWLAMNQRLRLGVGTVGGVMDSSIVLMMKSSRIKGRARKLRCNIHKHVSLVVAWLMASPSLCFIGEP